MKITKTVDKERVIHYKNEKGEYHREDGPAFIDGEIKEWYINGKHHREDGPAIIDSDYKAWYINGERHREDGPARINGAMKEYWLNGKQYTEDEFQNYILKKKLNKIKDL